MNVWMRECMNLLMYEYEWWILWCMNDGMYDLWMYEFMTVCLNEGLNDGMYECMNGINDGMFEWMIVWMYKWWNAWMYECVNV